MKLTTEEYRRGLLSWDIDSNAALRTSTAESLDEPPVWSEFLTDASGSKVQSPPYRYAAISITPEDPTALARPHSIRWERLLDDAIVTTIWGGRHPVKLLHVPDYGVFHRLVVATPTLAWPEDIVIRHGKVIVRLVEGLVMGERVTPMDQVETEGNKIILSGGSGGAAVATGRFIEIVAPGDSPELAEQHAESLLGVIAVCLGENAVGETIFSEPHAASAEQQSGMHRIPVTARIPVMADGSQVDTIDQVLPATVATDAMARSRRLALRSYGRAMRAGTSLDAFLALFVGIEAIANTYASEHGPTPERAAREKRLAVLLQGLPQPVDPDTKRWLRDGLLRPPLEDNFRYFVKQHDLDEALVDKFRELRRVRNDVVHGRVATLQKHQAYQAQTMLGQLLGAELGVAAATYPDDLPMINELFVGYDLAREEVPGDAREPGSTDIARYVQSDEGSASETRDREHPRFAYSGLIDLREETLGTAPLQEYGGKTAREMREELKRLAALSAETPLPFSAPKEASATSEAFSSDAVRMEVEEIEPGVFRFTAVDVSKGEDPGT